MKVTVRQLLKLEGLDHHELNTIKAHFNRPNPEYVKAVMTRTPIPAGTPGELPVWKEYKDRATGQPIVFLPRGTMKELKSLLPTSQFEISDMRISVPLDYAINLAGMEPRKYQQEARDAAVKAQQGYFIAPCGAGKTNIFIMIAASLRQRTLAVVHTEQLMNQFAERYEALTGLKAGLFYGKKREIRDFTVGINKSIVTGLIGTPEYERFGLLIFDECDLTPANTFQRILETSPAKYRIGATATYERKDGQSIMIDWQLGRKIYHINHDDLDKVITPEIYFVRGPKPNNYPCWKLNRLGNWEKKTSDEMSGWEKGAGTMQKRAVINSRLAKNPERINMIVKMIMQEYNRGETVVVIAASRAHCEIYQKLIRANGARAEIIDQKTKNRDEIIEWARAGKVRIILGIIVTDRGMDIPAISRVFITYSKDSRQAIGRGTRPCEGKKNLRAFEIVDDHPDIIKKYKRKKKELEEYYNTEVKWISPEDFFRN